MKAILGFTRMSVRGLNKVKRELGFVLMALNIRKVVAQRVKIIFIKRQFLYYFNRNCLFSLIQELYVPDSYYFSYSSSSKVSVVLIHLLSQQVLSLFTFLTTILLDLKCLFNCFNNITLRCFKCFNVYNATLIFRSSFNSILF